MPDTKIAYDTRTIRHWSSSATEQEQQAISIDGAQEPAAKSGYFAVSPHGIQITIPKELFVAFSDFMQTRKCPGSIAIQFQGGEITCIEALARKTYRNKA